MPSISEYIYENLYNANSVFTIDMMKTEAVLNAMKRELDINYKRAELKVYQENGTMDDYDYLCEEAESGFRSGVVKVLTKLKESITTFFSNLKDRVVSLFSNDKVNDTLDKVSKKIKFVPFAKNQKLIVADIDAQNKVSDAALAECEKLEAKMLSGQDIDDDAIDDLSDNYKKKMEKATGVSSAKQITLGAAADIIKKAMSTAGNNLKTLEKYLKDGIDKVIGFFKKLGGSIPNKTNTGDMSDSTIAKIENIKAKVGQEKGSNLVKFIADCMSSLKEKAKGVFDTKSRDKSDVKEESSDDSYSYYDSYFEQDEDASDVPTSDEDMGDAPDIEESEDSYISVFDSDFVESEDSDADSEYASGKKPSNESLVDSIFKQVSDGWDGKDSSGKDLYESVYADLFD